MRILNVLEELQDNFVQYVKAVNHLDDDTSGQEISDDLLRKRFFTSPYIQVVPPYEHGRSIGDLVEDGTLNPKFNQILPADWELDRKLYKHQESTIVKSSTGSNIVISTGTGSGKTESFLFPIFNHLLNEIDKGTIGDPGVRALILYPMNALVNDQLERLRRFLSNFQDAITFGQYTGETPRGEKEALEKYVNRYKKEPLKNELISREQILKAPPHILITNYSMLEYQLIRPKDSVFFDGDMADKWKFLAVDEVHMYDGAKAMEIALLLRKLKQRALDGNRHEYLQCFATSATLGSGSGQKNDISSFASNLFGESFSAEDVILSTLKEEQSGKSIWKATPEDFKQTSNELSSSVATPDTSIETYNRYLNEEICQSIQRKLKEVPTISVDDLKMHFNDEYPSYDLKDVLDVMMLSVIPGGKSLLDAKFHLFVRGLEGVYSCDHPEHPENISRFIFDRDVNCKYCKQEGVNSTYFEVGSCKSCGVQYRVGHFDGSKVRLANEEGIFTDADFFFQYRINVEEDLDLDEIKDGVETAELCVECGELLDEDSIVCSEGHGTLQKIIYSRIDTYADEEFRTCFSCAKKTVYTGIVRRGKITQEEATLNLGIRLHQHLPGTDPSLPGQGRKLLVFSDSRQKAASYAPAIENEYRQYIDRSLIYQSLLALESQEQLERVSFTRLKTSIDELIGSRKASIRINSRDDRGESLYDEESSSDILVSELSPYLDRYSLEKLQLVKVDYNLDYTSFKSIIKLEKHGCTHDQAIEIIQVLINSMRAHISLQASGLNHNSQRFSPRKITYFSREGTSEKAVQSWLPRSDTGTNQRLAFLVKELGLDKPGRNVARDLLSSVWDDLLNDEHGLLTLDNGKCLIKTKKIFYSLIKENRKCVQCDTCNEIFSYKHLNTCPKMRCYGSLFSTSYVDNTTTSYFSSLYKQMKLVGLTANEHTAQLSPEEARDVQRKFQDGKLNILSCSTTFEVGVDVGEVQAVLMRNLPPSPSNYIQRAGRAARRAGMQALVVSYADSATHDYHYFLNQLDMIEGKPSSPILTLDNESIIRRHVYSLAISQFLRSSDKYKEQIDTAGSIVGINNEGIDYGESGFLYNDFQEWIRINLDTIYELVRNAFEDLPIEISLEDIETYFDLLYKRDKTEGIGGWLKNAYEEMTNWVAELVQTRNDFAKSNEQLSGRRMDDCNSFIRNLVNEDGLSFLGNNGIIPKYGFPIDITELKPYEPFHNAKNSKVRLQRQMVSALREFVPGSTVLANGRVYESKGVILPPDGVLSSFRLEQCENGCGHVDFSPLTGDSDDISLCPKCGEKLGKPLQFSVPSQGFAATSNPYGTGDMRRSFMGSVDYSFYKFDKEDKLENKTLQLNRVKLFYRRGKNAWIIATNGGTQSKKFYMCSVCGSTSAKRESGHYILASLKYGKQKKCGATLNDISIVNFGYRFLTDAIEIRYSDVWKKEENSEVRAKSIGAALIAALPAIGIIPDDVGLNTSQYGDSIYLRLFDSFPGGAGHSKRIEDRIEELFEAAKEKVLKCSCGEETSCYSCLRSYSNQRDHYELKRQYVIDFFNA